MQISAYHHTGTYFSAVDHLEAIARNFDPASPSDLRTQIIEALGDLGVWPMSCFTGQDEGEVIVVA